MKTTEEYWKETRQSFYLLYGAAFISAILAGSGLYVLNATVLVEIGIGMVLVALFGMGFLIGGAEHDYWEYVRLGKIEDPGAEARKSIFQKYDGEKKRDFNSTPGTARGDSTD